MDWSTQLFTVAGVASATAVVRVVPLVVTIRYAKWLRRHGVPDPEKRAEWLLKASRPDRPAIRPRRTDEEDPPAAA